MKNEESFQYIIINEALCSMDKKVCYILFPTAKFGLLLEQK